ncbi:MAG: methyltransferase domain-containing protein [Chloroflexi bacterium]|nr:methyltransferase domain-containing protein [Chloroflexota bacterium]
MNYAQETYTLTYDPLDQQIDFVGACRPAKEDEVRQIFRYLVGIHDQVQGVLRLNFRRLRYINAAGLKAVSLFLAYARGCNARKIKLIASGVLAWGERALPTLRGIWEEVEFLVHDKDFYKSQDIIEDLEFIPLLRNQTRILWPQEKEVLRRHGLNKGMKTADICCGCGDVPLLISREFQTGSIVGVDHSEAAIDYARNLQGEFNIANIDFQRGDATALMLNDSSFDFVLCRLSLQIFSQPELILQELIRIAKPGGRIYTLCEDYDLVVGYPESDLIRQTYNRAAIYGDQIGMDLRQGKKLYGMLAEARLEDIQTDHIIIDTNNAERESFARVIESWQKFSVDTIGAELGLSSKDQASLSAGYDAQLRAIRSPYGYTTWGMTACSGRKPL